MYQPTTHIPSNWDPETVIWKYLDFSKFVDLLLTRQLFMSRSDKFEDQYEGTFSEPTFEEINKLSVDNPDFLKHYKQFRESVVISSWHINEYESFAMWQIFTQRNEGIAIQSTIGRLQNSLSAETVYPQHIGEVKYIDYKKEYIPFDNSFFPFLFKRKSFQYEKEIRVLTDVTPFGKTIDNGLKIDVNLEELVKAIYIHPKSANWYKKLVFDVVSRLNYDFPIAKSDLESDILI